MFLITKIVGPCILLLMAVIAAPAVAWQTARSDASQQDENQKWQGVLDAGVAQLTLNFDVTRSAAGSWSGDIYSADQGNAKIPISKMVVDGDQVTIETKTPPAKFVGTMAEDGQSIEGKWFQGPVQHDLVIRRVESFAEGEHVETWQGTLEAAGKSFDFGLRVFRMDDGTWLARLDSYNENAMNLRAPMERGKTRFDFTVPISSADYSGTLDENAETVTGVWKQAGGEYPLDFKKVELDAGPGRDRPQHPQEPFPYDQEDVQFVNRTDDVVLAGTLTLPPGEGPWPAMILISGSGPQDRDETIFDHKPFLVIADHLTRHGIAVLRYDDRGTNESTGNFATATSEDFARDAEAGVALLKARADIDPGKIGLIGHSEGGIIAPMIAARSPDVALIVLLAGTGVDGAAVTVSQSRAMAEAANTPPDLVKASEFLLERVLSEIAKNDEPLNPEFVDQVFSDAVAQLDNPDLAPALENARAGLALIDTPWFRFFARFDPQTTLKQVPCPVLALNGTRDVQVLVDLNIDAIDEALRAGGNPDFEVHKLDNLNHLFQETEGDGSILEYGRIEQTFSPAALQLITDWILDRTQ